MVNYLSDHGLNNLTILDEYLHKLKYYSKQIAGSHHQKFELDTDIDEVVVGNLRRVALRKYVVIYERNNLLYSDIN